MADKRRDRGGGFIEQRGNRFRVVISGGVDSATGKRKKVTRSFTTKKAAVQWRADQIAEAARNGGHLAGTAGLSTGAWLDQWLTIKREEIEPGSWQFYERRVRLHLKPRIGTVPLDRLTPQAVSAMHVKMVEAKVSSGERRNSLTTLRAALESAVRLRMLPTNPAKPVPKPKASKGTRMAMDADQARAFLAAVSGNRYAPLYELALDSGARPGELLGLHWPDIDLDAGTIFVRQSLEEVDGGYRLKAPKTPKSRRTIHLTRRSVAALVAHREAMRAEGRDVERGPVFVNREGGWLSQPTLYRRVWQPALERAGLSGFSPYSLRHASATLLLQQGASLKLVSERLGHENVEMTLRHYAHVLPADQDRAVGILERLFGEDSPQIVPNGATLEHSPETAKAASP